MGGLCGVFDCFDEHMKSTITYDIRFCEKVIAYWRIYDDDDDDWLAGWLGDKLW